VRRVGGVVLDPQLAQPEPLGEPVGAQQRRPAGRQVRAARRRLDGQEVAVAPQRMRPGLDATTQLLGVDAGRGRLRHLERAEAALADVPRVQRIRRLAFFAGQ
jgi:hypothetical protein